MMVTTALRGIATVHDNERVIEPIGERGDAVRLRRRR
jgi:hypothetical protein